MLVLVSVTVVGEVEISVVVVGSLGVEVVGNTTVVDPLTVEMEDTTVGVTVDGRVMVVVAFGVVLSVVIDNGVVVVVGAGEV